MVANLINSHKNLGQQVLFLIDKDWLNKDNRKTILLDKFLWLRLNQLIQTQQQQHQLMIFID